MPIKKPIRCPLLLHQEERRMTPTCLRLQTTEQMDDMQPIPPPSHQQTHLTCPRSISVFQIQHMLGIQQCAHQTRRRMEGYIYHESRPVRTKSHVFWSHKFPCHIPNHNEHHLCRRITRELVDNQYGRHPDPHHR